MLRHGLSGVTTRQISQEVGCSEGTLYVHYDSRLDLLLAMLEESLPEMLGPLQTLQQRVGLGSAQANLAVALGGIYRFHQRATPHSGRRVDRANRCTHATRHQSRRPAAGWC